MERREKPGRALEIGAQRGLGCPHTVHSGTFSKYQPASPASRRAISKQRGFHLQSTETQTSVTDLLGGHDRVMSMCHHGKESDSPWCPSRFLPRGGCRGSPPSVDFLRQFAPQRLAAGSPQNLQREEKYKRKELESEGFQRRGLSPVALRSCLDITHRGEKTWEHAVGVHPATAAASACSCQECARRGSECSRAAITTGGL